MNPLAPSAQPNPLMAAQPAGAPQPNPLTAPPAPPQQHVSLLDKAAQAVKSLPPDEAALQSKRSNALVHLLAPMARGDAPVNMKEVAKVAAEMVAEGYTSASEAVRFLGKMPTDHAELAATVKKWFQGSLATAISLHGAQAITQDTPAVPAPPVAPPPGAPPVAGASA